MSMKRAAARLHVRSDDFAAVREQYVGRITVDVGKEQILYAARKQAHAVTLISLRALDGSYQLMGETRQHTRGLRLELAESSW
jgi:hypothetical protein